MFSRRPAKKAAPAAAPAAAKASRKPKALLGSVDEDDEFAAPPTPPAMAWSLHVTEVTDCIFHRAKLRLQCPPRWRVLLLAAAKRLEKQLGKLREEMFMAAALDDVEALQRLKPQIPPKLWTWWAYDLGIIARATARLRPEQLELLPALWGKAYKDAGSVVLERAAMEVRPLAGSAPAILERQRGEALIAPVRQAFEKGGEIDVKALQDLLDQPSCGPWRETKAPAIGVNYGAAKGDFAGWRPLHFVAAASSARKTSAEAALLLLDARSNAMLTDSSGATALQVAAANNHQALVELLIERGAPVESVDLRGCTALLTAARGRHAFVVRRLARWSLPADASFRLLCCEAEQQAQRFSVARGVELHEQVAAGDNKRVRELVLVGDGKGADLADVNFADSLGRSPLHTAAKSTSGDHRASDVLRALVALRANVDACDLDGESALHVGVRCKRAPVVRTLLRLRAHPGLADKNGRTPLMLAAAAPEDVREPLVYDGVLVNRPVAWKVVEDILSWNGEGDPPGPPTRRVKKQAKSLKDEAEERQKATSPKAYTTPGERVKARGEALAAVGFDDQWIVNLDGRVNRGDRLQLCKALLTAAAGDQESPFLDRTRAPGVSTRRMRVLWEKLTGPMLRMEVQGTLAPRLGELLHYVLLSMLGPQGPAFGALAAACIGTSDAVLPTWEQFQEVLESEDDLHARLAAVHLLGFRGPLPKKAVWVGSVWAKDDYPRDPDTAPWAALKYVDRDTAKRLNQGANQVVRVYSAVSVVRPFTTNSDVPVKLKAGERGRVRELDSDGDAYIKFDGHEIGQLVFRESFEHLQVEATFEDEAFKGNDMPPFEAIKEELALPTGTKPTPYRTEQLQLSNRLFVDEPLGMRIVAEERLRLAGERLLCPLLAEAAAGLAAEGLAAERVAEHRGMLRYVASQMEDPMCDRTEPPSLDAWEKAFKRWMARRRPFAEAWKRTRVSIARSLLEQPAPELAGLTPGPDVLLSEQGAMLPSARDVPEQSAVLPEEMVAWLHARHSTRAFIELRSCGAAASADDFNQVVVGIGAKSPKDFAEHFWRGAFYLILWGRARHLQPFFQKELRRRLPEGTLLLGPFVRPRSDYLLEMERKAQEDAAQKRQEDACWTAWEEAEQTRKKAVGQPHWEAVKIKAAAKVMAPRLARHLRTWRNVAFTGEPFKPNTGEEGLAHGGGLPAARMLSDRAPVAVDRSLAESRAATGAHGLPTGLTDVLRAQVVCDTPDALRAAFLALCAPPPPPPKAVPQAARSLQDDEPVEPRGHFVSFRTVRIINDFHEEQHHAALPRAARLLLLARLSAQPRGISTVAVQQLVEVELLLPTTAEARWLADFLQLDPAEVLAPDFGVEPPPPLTAQLRTPGAA